MPSPFLKPAHRRGTNKFGKEPGKFSVKRISQNLPKLSGPPRAPREHHQRFSYGPDIAGIAYAAPGSGPGEPPEWFLGPQTTKTEWFLYWALEKLLGPEGVEWEYQGSAGGNLRQFRHAQIDFIIYQGARQLAVRVQSFRFHMDVGPFVQQYDEDQFIGLHQPGMIVVDVFEEDFIFDETGQAAIKVMLDVMNLNIRPNPIVTGNVVRV